jgi:hypothetical protein
MELARKWEMMTKRRGRIRRHEVRRRKTWRRRRKANGNYGREGRMV